MPEELLRRFEFTVVEHACRRNVKHKKGWVEFYPKSVRYRLSYIADTKEYVDADWTCDQYVNYLGTYIRSSLVKVESFFNRATDCQSIEFEFLGSADSILLYFTDTQLKESNEFFKYAEQYLLGQV